MKYDESTIEVLEGLEAVRRRPGMYVGGTDARALHHIAYEVIDNAVDEALAGECTQVAVTVHQDGSLSVRDNGRGIPVGLHPEKGVSVLTLAFTELHAGGKFNDGGGGAYSTSGGLHGVGIKATNALSKCLAVTVWRDGVRYRQRFENGDPVTPVQILDPHREAVIGEVGKRGSKTAIREHRDKSVGTGTQVTFLPSGEVLETTEFDFVALARRLQTISFLVPGLACNILDDRTDARREYHHEKGLVQYVEHLNRDNKAIHKPITISGEAPEHGLRLDVALQYHASDDEGEALLAFANIIPTPEGGTHVSGFRAAVTKAINTFAEEKRQLKKGDEITGRDTTAGLTAVVSLKLPDPQFTSQTKTKLSNAPVHGAVYSIVYDALLRAFRKNVSLGRKIVERCLAASRARRAAAKARKLVVRKSVLEAADTLPGKLADVARGVPTHQTTLFIVEGDSAGGSCKQARDRNYHAILPLRGKVLNTEKARLNRALGNNEIKAIVAAIGAGVKADFSLEDMRYGRVAILVDADVDGAHIETLLHTLFWRLMRPMVDAGRLYVARAPLYLFRANGNEQYLYTEAELQRALEHVSGKHSLQRYKGLGEMNPEQLRETVFALDDPESGLNAHLYQVQAPDPSYVNRVMSLWMGGSAAERRERLLNHWDEVEVLENGE